jgi:hypothetical protein
MRFKKIAFVALMLAVSVYILMPTADEIVIHPTFGLFLSYTLSIPYLYGVFLSIIIYRAIGVGCLVVALLVGGKPTYYALKEKIAKKGITRKF